MIRRHFALAACGDGGGKTVKLYGATYPLVGDVSDLVLLDPDDGSFISSIGSVGHRLNGLEYDAVSNKLYGTTSTSDPTFPRGLIEIDMKTAVPTNIGAAVIKIARPTVNSNGDMFAWDCWQTSLVTVNKVTGSATIVGDSGIFFERHGLAFDNEDILYLVDDGGEIYTIDTANGSATFTSSIGMRAHHGDFHPETGHYWGIDETRSTAGGPGKPRKLLVVDVNTPAVIDSLSTVNDLHTITFYYD
jgi:hypothetical protein